jgi:hypothetical protein
MIGSGMIARSLPYKEGFGVKQMAWMVHAGIMGAVVAPLTLLGGPLLVRAAWYTAGVVGGKLLCICCWAVFIKSFVSGEKQMLKLKQAQHRLSTRHGRSYNIKTQNHKS